MNRTCEKCIHHDVCRKPLEYSADPETCWKYEEPRPHGEWIMHKNFEGYLRFYECSNCSHTQGYLTDFRDTCGADMRKSGESE